MTKQSFRAVDAVPPQPRKEPHSDARHGITRIDEYNWLRAGNWQDVFRDPALLDPEIRAHLDAENAYQEALMADTSDLQKRLFQEMKGRIKEDDSSVPIKDGPYAYGSAYRIGGQHPRFYRTPRDGGPEELILDGDLESQGKAFFSIGDVEHASDHRRVLWSYDDRGSELYTLVVRDLATQADLADRVPDTAGSGTWSADNAGFFYTRLDSNHRPSKAYYHRIGTDVADDRLVYEEADPGFFMSVGGSRLNDWIMISIGDHETSEYRLIPANDPLAEPTVVSERRTGLEYELEEGGDVFFILTNADGAKDYKIVTAPVADPRRANWTDLVAHEPGRLILSIQAFRDFLVRLERKDGLPRIVVRERASGAEHVIAFDEEAYSLGLSGLYEYDTGVMRFTYSSMTTPAQVFDYDMETRARVLRRVRDVPSGHDAAAYVTRRVEATAADGTKVPVSLLYAKKTPLDGSAPVWLLGYGSYGDVEQPEFVPGRLSLVDRGFIYAIAHVRGGGDKGDAWHEAGRLRNKTTTFTDFIAVTEHLIAERFTSKGRVVAYGASAGGTLVGAVANMRPDLYGAIIAEVPFVDVLNTMLDRNLPLTESGFSEFGNPIDSAEDFAAMRAYSPYDNVKAQAYPPILAEQALNDTRVPYWEATKWVAKLRQMKTGDAPVILWMKEAGGHSGGGGRYDGLADIARVYAFALTAVGRGR